MNTMIVLKFFGILGYTVFEHVRTGPEGCRDVYDQAVSDFKLEQFFKGSWYHTYAKYQNYTALCTKFNMTTNPLQMKYKFSDANVTCEGTEIEGARHIEFKCKGDWETPTENTDYEAIMSVIDTDYTSYAIVYTCKKSAKHEENVYVLSRTQDGETPEAAKKSLQKLGEQFDKFDKYSCIFLVGDSGIY